MSIKQQIMIRAATPYGVHWALNASAALQPRADNKFWSVKTLGRHLRGKTLKQKKETKWLSQIPVEIISQSEKTEVSGFPKAQKMAHVVPTQLQVAKQVAGETTEGTSAVQMNKPLSSRSGLTEKSLPAGRVMIHPVWLMASRCVSVTSMGWHQWEIHCSPESCTPRICTRWGSCCTALLPTILTVCSPPPPCPAKPTSGKFNFPQHAKKSWKKDSPFIYCLPRRKPTLPL